MPLLAELNKTTYEPGEVMTLTVTTSEGERNRDVPIVVRVHIEGVGDAEVNGVVDKPDEAIIVTDSARSWTKQSDDGSVAVFTATA